MTEPGLKTGGKHWYIHRNLSKYQALARVTWKNFSERIGLCLGESRHPFFVEF
jgi:hypothetical protein